MKEIVLWCPDNEGLRYKADPKIQLIGFLTNRKPHSPTMATFFITHSQSDQFKYVGKANIIRKVEIISREMANIRVPSPLAFVIQIILTVL